MAKFKHKPRLENLDVDFVRRALATMQQIRVSTLAAERIGQLKRPLAGYAMAFRISLGVGLLSYALGSPIDEVRSYFAESARHLYKVYELVGTDPPFPVTLVALGREGDVVRREPLHPPDHIDFSLTNSADGLKGMYLALIVGDLELSQSFANMVWDPPDADYIGPDSETCTPNQQHLAYAVKYLLLRSPQECLQELDLIDTQNITRDIHCQVKVVRAIALGQAGAFVHNLEALLAWHENNAPNMIQQLQPGYPNYCLSISALGLVALARVMGVVHQVHLASVYLPLALLGSG